MPATSFPAETFAFLEGIAAHNDRAWFDANRALYDIGYVAAGKTFIEALGPRLRAISPAVQFEPRINGSLFRINRDIRFSKDKRPYKEHLALWFWHGETKGWQTPGFWFDLSATAVHMGAGMYAFPKPALDEFRQCVVHPRSGKALLAAVEAVKAAGPYEIGGRTRKQLPKGFVIDADRTDFLLHEGLYTSIELPAASARDAYFLDRCVGHFADSWPVAKWLLDEGIGG